MSKNATYTNTRKLHTGKDRKLTFDSWLPLIDQEKSWIFDPHSGYKYTTESLCQTDCLVILTKYMSLHKSNSPNQSRQLMRPMWRVETMVLPVYKSAVERLAYKRRKHIRLHRHETDSFERG